MPSKSNPVTADQAREAYVRTGTMQAAGDELGISAARVQAILAKSGGTPATLSPSERDLLEAIVTMTETVERGPSVARLAEKFGITPRGLRQRAERLRKSHFVLADEDGRLTATTAAKYMLNAATRQNGKP